MQPSTRRLRLAFSLFFLGLVLFAWLKRETIYDYYRLNGYTPSARVAELANQTTMTDGARRLFYVQHPSLEDKGTFSQHCGGHEHSIVLGCYILRRGIYIYDIQDERLNGVEEVTAAHELLHAQYDRLSGSEKQRVVDLLEAAYAKVTNERIRSSINSYKEVGADVANELHSILGTEVRDLPPDLETYYKKYFKDRLRVVSFSEQYEQAFTERKNKVEEYDRQLKSLKEKIESSQNDLAFQNEALKQERERLDQLLDGKRYDEYNSGVPGFNEQVRQYNNDIKTVQDRINTYNSILSERNAIALEEQELYKALDSRITPQATE